MAQQLQQKRVPFVVAVTKLDQEHLGLEEILRSDFEFRKRLKARQEVLQ